MANIKKILIISGSARNGNTNFLLTKILNSIKNADKELILLKDKDIKFCRGCLFCHTKPECAIKDDMAGILEKMRDADLIILGTPNYFDNVSGLMKNFMDRCHPLYKFKLVKNKKLILIFVGGGETAGTRKSLSAAFRGFVDYLYLKLIGTYSFKALKANDLSKKNISKEITKITKKINSLK